jgi:hypothetical protein
MAGAERHYMVQRSDREGGLSEASIPVVLKTFPSLATRSLLNSDCLAESTASFSDLGGDLNRSSRGGDVARHGLACLLDIGENPRARSA